MSPSNRPGRMLTRIETYLNFGTRLVWVDIDGVLDGEDVLPGFSIPVRRIFRV